jgi:hypothetical protein
MLFGHLAVILQFGRCGFQIVDYPMELTISAAGDGKVQKSHYLQAQPGKVYEEYARNSVETVTAQRPELGSTWQVHCSGCLPPRRPCW